MVRLAHAAGLASLFACVSSCAVDRPVAATVSTLKSFGTVANAMASVRISEIHYDNEGTDVLEGVEISGPAGQDLTGWKVVPYNGNGGASYLPIVDLSGLIPETCAPRGVIVVPVIGLQNGSPDGVALVDAAGAVVEFLSYEGSFTAANGPAAGRTSTDIGTRETGLSPEPASPPEAVRSLQRNAADVWSTPTPHTFGACNDVPAPTTPIARVSIAPASATILAGTTQSFTAIAFDAEDNPVPGAPLTWESSDPVIAIVTAGAARGLEPGTVEIKATAVSGA